MAPLRNYVDSKRQNEYQDASTNRIPASDSELFLGTYSKLFEDLGKGMTRTENTN